MHIGALVLDSQAEPLSLGVDNCVSSAINFTETALHSYDTVINNGSQYETLTWLLSQLHLGPLAGALGHAGGFSVICAYFVQQILGTGESDALAPRIDLTNDIKMGKSTDVSETWIEVNRWENEPENDLQPDFHFKGTRSDDLQLATNLIVTHLHATMAECSPNVLSRELMSGEQEFSLSQHLDETLQLSGLLQQVANAFGNDLGHPCLGDVIYTLLDDSADDFLSWNKARNPDKETEWRQAVLDTIAATPELKYGLRTVFLCVLSNVKARKFLTESLLPIRYGTDIQRSSKMTELCHVYDVYLNYNSPHDVITPLLAKLGINIQHLERCAFHPRMSTNLDKLSAEELLRVQIVLATIRFHEEKERKKTFIEQDVLNHLSEAQLDFVQTLSEPEILALRESTGSSHDRQWQYDCVLSLVEIFSRPVRVRQRRWGMLSWFTSDNSTELPETTSESDVATQDNEADVGTGIPVSRTGDQNRNNEANAPQPESSFDEQDESSGAILGDDDEDFTFDSDTSEEQIGIVKNEKSLDEYSEFVELGPDDKETGETNDIDEENPPTMETIQNEEETTTTDKVHSESETSTGEPSKTDVGKQHPSWNHNKVQGRMLSGLEDDRSTTARAEQWFGWWILSESETTLPETSDSAVEMTTTSVTRYSTSFTSQDFGKAETTPHRKNKVGNLRSTVKTTTPAGKAQTEVITNEVRETTKTESTTRLPSSTQIPIESTGQTDPSNFNARLVTADNERQEMDTRSENDQTELFRALQGSKLVTALVELLSGKLSKDSSVIFIKLLQEVFFGRNSVSADDMIRFYQNSLEATEQQPHEK